MKPTPDSASRVRMWFAKRKKKNKEKEQKERALEPPPLKILTFAITLASMALGLSLMPLFPQPLPILLAFLVAFITYKKPRFGMPIGTFLIGLGLMYQLATLDFIAMVGEPLTRAAVVVVFLGLFFALPLIFKRYKQAIALNFGIIAGILLFYNQIYYLAVPLILTAVVLFKKSSVLTVVYYVLISVPLTMMQYLNYILQIGRVDWWVEPGSSPPLYVSLSSIFQQIQQSMLQFRLYDTSKVVYAIVDQVTAPSNTARLNLSTVLNQYLDSMPGIALFLAIVIGVVFAVALVGRFIVKGGLSEMDRFFPSFLAAGATALFFILLSVLQNPLAFRADINIVQTVIATLAATLFTLPTAFVELSPKKNATLEMILEKAEELMAKLKNFEALLNKAKSTLPVVAAVSSTEAKMLVLKDKISDTISNTSKKSYNTSELDKKFNELDPGLKNEIDALFSELSVTLGEYQIYINCEYSAWLGKFVDKGFEVKATAKTDFQKDLPIDLRIDNAKEVLEGGRLLASEVIQVSEQIYETIRSLFDTNLSEKSQTVTFAKQKLDEASPWSAMDALFTALNNWRKQYGIKIAQAVKALHDSLATIAKLSIQSDRLLPVLGSGLPELMDCAKRAETAKLRTEKPVGIMSVITIRTLLQSSLSIAREVLSILYAKIESMETAIESLVPTKNYLWERNVTLRKRMATAMEVICGSKKHRMDKVLENLPKALADIDECVDTLVKYADKKELLLNYPIAEMAIDDLFKQKKSIAAQDLPFEPKYAEKYLRLFYSRKYSDFSFDEANVSLMRRTCP